MGRKSLKDLRQKEILIGFYQVAKKEGLENTSIAKVASHMEINPSLILHYFKTRDEILLSFNDFILERYKRIYHFPKSRIESQSDLVVLIDRLFSRQWNRLISDGVFYSCYAKIYQDNKLKKSFQSMHNTLRELLCEALEKAKVNGVIQVSNTQELSERIYIILEGTYYYLGMVDDKFESDRKLKIVKNQIFEMLGMISGNLEVSATSRTSADLSYKS
jgi:AcrR family transcriptional regulator